MTQSDRHRQTLTRNARVYQPDRHGIPTRAEAGELDDHGVGGIWTEAFERLHTAHLAGAPPAELERLAGEELDEPLLREENLT